MTVRETENQVILDRLYERVWTGETHDFDVMDEVFAEHAVVEYPQSGERIRGRANIRAVEENYPGLPKVTIRRKFVVGDLGLVECDLDYQGKRYQEVRSSSSGTAKSFASPSISRSPSRLRNRALGGWRGCSSPRGHVSSTPP